MTYGAHFAPIGLLVGQATGSVIFVTLAVVTAFHMVSRLSGAVGRPGIGMAIPAGTGALATLAIRPWRNRHLSVSRYAHGATVNTVRGISIVQAAVDMPNG